MASAEIERARTQWSRRDSIWSTPSCALLSPELSAAENVEIGTVIQPGQPLMAIVPLDDVWVTANFKETQLR